MTRRINAAGLSLIKSFEGFVSKWYPDPAHGWKVPTVGYGHTDAAGPPKYADTKTKVFTEAEATAILANDVQSYADAVEKAVKVPLSDNQFAALVSFCYNVGPGNFRKSTLLRKLNAGDYGSVPKELAKWNKAGGKVLKGLVRRREAEGQLFRSQAASVAPAKPVAPVPAPEPVKPAPEPATVGFWAALLSIIAKLFRRAS